MKANPGPQSANDLVQTCSRRSRRHWLRHAGEATIEFQLEGGRPCSLDLLNLSEGGVCFGLDSLEANLGCDSTIEHVVLRVGDLEIEGRIRIAHVTEEFAAGTICGAEFEPASELDGQKLAKLITDIQE